jgi:hypothetical protein
VHPERMRGQGYPMSMPDPTALMLACPTPSGMLRELKPLRRVTLGSLKLS